jgi:hypothetical protein
LDPRLRVGIRHRVREHDRPLVVDGRPSPAQPLDRLEASVAGRSNRVWIARRHGVLLTECHDPSRTPEPQRLGQLARGDAFEQRAREGRVERRIVGKAGLDEPQ